MSKAIYLKYGKKVYRVIQDTSIPSVLNALPSSNHSSVDTDSRLGVVTANLHFTNMEGSCIKTNGEMYDELVKYLKDNQVTQIDTIQPRFKIYLDYSIYKNNCECDHNIVIRDLNPTDAAVLLGVGKNNECVYRRVKNFNPKVEFNINNALPLGIMKSASTNYKFKINDVSIYQDLSVIPNTIHNSIYNTSYCGCVEGGTIIDSLSNYAVIYSTAQEGIIISDIDLNFVPRKIIVDLKFCMASLIVAFDDSNINAIIQENVDKKYNVNPDPDGTNDNDRPGGNQSMLDENDGHVPADGSEVPNEDGWFDYYELCTSKHPGALLVVEDLISDRVYDATKMIKRRTVIKDIPNVNIGDYVRYVEATKDEDSTFIETPGTSDSGSSDTGNTGSGSGDSSTDGTNTQTSNDDDIIAIDIDEL